MNCRIAGDNMMKYFDGNLNDIESAQFKHHLKGCSKCNEEFQELSSILNVLENDVAIGPPQSFEESVMDKIRLLKPIKREKTDILLVLFYGAATLALLLLAGVFAAQDNFLAIFNFAVESLKPLNFISNIFEAVFTPIKELIGVLAQISFILLKTYFYIFVLLSVILFAIQWMFISLLRQDRGGMVR